MRRRAESIHDSALRFLPGESNQPDNLQFFSINCRIKDFFLYLPSLNGTVCPGGGIGRRARFRGEYQ